MVCSKKKLRNFESGMNASQYTKETVTFPWRGITFFIMTKDCLCFVLYFFSSHTSLHVTLFWTVINKWSRQKNISPQYFCCSPCFCFYCFEVRDLGKGYGNNWHSCFSKLLLDCSHLPCYLFPHPMCFSLTSVLTASFLNVLCTPGR